MSEETLYQEIIRRQRIEYARCDASLHLTDFSPGLAPFANQRPSAGQPLTELFDELAGLDNYLQDVRSGQEAPFQIAKTWRQLSDGRSGYFTFSLAPYQGGLLLLISDVTPHAQIEQRLMQQRNEVKLLNHRLDLVRLRMQELLTRFLPTEISQQVVGDPHAPTQSSQHATALFADLLGFTAWTQELDDDEILDLLNQALGSAIKTIQQADGVIDKYVGDAVLGLFNVMQDDPNHAFKAVLVAWQFIQAMRQADAFEFSIGISTDRATVGTISERETADYTTVGPAVNQARQLQDLAGAHQIVISAATYALVQDRVDVELIGSHRLEGRKMAADVYKVTAVHA